MHQSSITHVRTTQIYATMLSKTSKSINNYSDHTIFKHAFANLLQSYCNTSTIFHLGIDEQADLQTIIAAMISLSTHLHSYYN